MLRPEIECGYSHASAFDATLRNNLKAVADSVADAVEKLFGSSPPPAGQRRIWCFYEADTVPMLVIHPTEYPIRLSVLGRDYSKFAYQLSHELAHIMLDPRQDNWILEGLAVAVSLQTLEDLAESWQINPPYPHWASYAPNFATYRAKTITTNTAALEPNATNALKAGDWTAITDFLKGKRAFLDANPCDRPMNTLCAVRLMAEPMSWPTLVGLAAQTTPPPIAPAHFNANIPLDVAKLSPSVMEMLQRIGL